MTTRLYQYDLFCLSKIYTCFLPTNASGPFTPSSPPTCLAFCINQQPPRRLPDSGSPVFNSFSQLAERAEKMLASSESPVSKSSGPL